MSEQAFTVRGSSASIDTVGEPTLGVSMFGDHVVIRPPRHLDLDLTLVLVDAVGAAIRGGSSVMIDLDADTDSPDLVAVGPSAQGSQPTAVDNGSVDVLGPGYVRLSTADSRWTIDISRERLFRSDGAVDPSFVPTEVWTPIRAVWLTCSALTALCVDGSYISGRPSWRVSR